RTIDRVIRQQLSNRPRPGSLAAMLADAEYPDGAAMSTALLRDEILTLLSTGYETVGDALAWTLYLLAQNPSAESRLVSELEEVIGSRSPTIEDIPNLRYTRQVLDESMRLYPPTWIFVRMALKDDTLPGGVAIPRGSKVYLCQYVMHRSAKLFPDPLRF